MIFFDKIGIIFFQEVHRESRPPISSCLLPPHDDTTTRPSRDLHSATLTTASSDINCNSDAKTQREIIKDHNVSATVIIALFFLVLIVVKLPCYEN